MSFWTAFKLSARNLYSKLKRTILVVIAGSIGIIGVSAVLAVSQGVRDYITSIQDDLLSGNPIQVTKSGIDYEALMNSNSFQQNADALKQGSENGKVNVNSVVKYLVENQKALDSLAFQNEFNRDYISYVLSMPKEYYNSISLNYGMAFDYNIYTQYNVSHSESDPNHAEKVKYDAEISLDAINATYAKSLINIMNAQGYAEKAELYADLITDLSRPMAQTMNFNNNPYLKSQYDLVAGDYPVDSDSNVQQVLLVLDNDGLIADLSLAQLGYYSQEEFYDIIYDALNTTKKIGEKDIYVNNKDNLKTKFSYEELLGKTFTWYPNDTVFNKIGNAFNYLYKNEGFSKDNSLTLKVTGIVKLKDGTSYGAIKNGFFFSEATAKEMIKRNINSEFVKFIDQKIKDAKAAQPNKKIDSITSTITYDLSYFWEAIDSSTGNLIPFNGDKTVPGYDKSSIVIGEGNTTSNLTGFFTGGDTSSLSTDLTELIDFTKLIQLSSHIKDGEQEAFWTELSEELKNAMMTAMTGRKIYLKTFGGTYIPNSISIYPVNFEKKDLVTNYLKDWNKIEGTDAKSVTFNVFNEDFTQVVGETTLTNEQRQEIKYTDTVGLIIGLINTMIDIVTYALVGFTALSLIVSTVMIAIITYVSVMERVKEIGVIRSLGGRKKDVSHLFNAEAFILGLTSGVFGVIITYILQLLGNIVVRFASGGVVMRIANLTPLTAVIMILVSILLTTISGVMPARSAAKKDPVVALRTE